jgi:phosphohistidine phosphatase
MLKLWLARHGEAADQDTVQSDFSRVLTETGRRQVSELTRWIIQREQPPELILHSPLVRAQQTAEAVAAAIGDDSIVVRVENALAPGVDLDELLRRVSSTVVERILCVGHQPDMSRCLAGMIGGGDIQYSPGTVAGIEFPGPIIRHGGRLRWVVKPNWFGG